MSRLTLIPRKLGVRRSPRDAWAHYHLAKALLNRQDWAAAERAYRQTLKLNDRIALAHHELAEVLVKQPLGVSEAEPQYLEAIEHYQRAIELDPDFSWSFHNLGDVLRSLERWEDAAQAYERAAQLNPEFAPTFAHLGEALMRSQRWEAAIAAYERANQLNSHDFQVLYNLAAAYDRVGDRAAVAQTYLKTIDVDANFPWYYYSFFWKTLDAENCLGEAERRYKSALQNQPHQLGVYINLGDTLVHAQKIPESLPYYQQALAIKLEKNYGFLNTESQEKPLKESPLDFIILGAQKAGTTSLYSYMSKHPKIVPALRKEVEFWSWKFHRGLDWYLAHFPKIPRDRHLLTGEACPGYLDFPETAERLREHFPNLKFIVLLRNPVDRAISHYYHWVRRNQEKLPLEQAIEEKRKEIEEKGTVWRIHSNYLARGIYVEFLKHWFSIFPREQFLILESEPFNGDPSSTLHQVYDFLGLPAYDLAEYKKYNSGSYSPAETEIRAELAKFYAPYNRELEELLGRSLSWSNPKSIQEET